MELGGLEPRPPGCDPAAPYRVIAGLQEIHEASATPTRPGLPGMRADTRGFRHSSLRVPERWARSAVVARRGYSRFRGRLCGRLRPPRQGCPLRACRGRGQRIEPRQGTPAVATDPERCQHATPGSRGRCARPQPPESAPLHEWDTGRPAREDFGNHGRDHGIDLQPPRPAAPVTDNPRVDKHAMADRSRDCDVPVGAKTLGVPLGQRQHDP
jgi:hypothetical protein